MKMKNLLASITLMVLVAINSATAAIIVSDDFESYADTAAMQAVWGASGVGTLDTAAGNPGQSYQNNGGNQNQQTIAGLVPTAAEPIVFSVDIFDDGASANKRMTAGLRNSATANLFEMGMFNAPAHYAVRAVLPGPSWVAFSGMVNDAGQPITNSPVVGWHTYKLILDGSNATFTLDLNGDGNINGTQVIPVAFLAANPINTVRLGLGLTSAGGGANFDNVLLAVVPEPTSLLLAGMLGMAMGCARTRR
jgi:hypothetical protein